MLTVNNPNHGEFPTTQDHHQSSITFISKSDSKLKTSSSASSLSSHHHHHQQQQSIRFPSLDPSSASTTDEIGLKLLSVGSSSSDRTITDPLLSTSNLNHHPNHLPSQSSLSSPPLSSSSSSLAIQPKTKNTSRSSSIKLPNPLTLSQPTHQPHHQEPQLIIPSSPSQLITSNLPSPPHHQKIRSIRRSWFLSSSQLHLFTRLSRLISSPSLPPQASSSPQTSTSSPTTPTIKSITTSSPSLSNSTPTIASSPVSSAFSSRHSQPPLSSNNLSPNNLSSTFSPTASLLSSQIMYSSLPPSTTSLANLNHSHQLTSDSRLSHQHLQPSHQMKPGRPASLWGTLTLKHRSASRVA